MNCIPAGLLHFMGMQAENFYVGLKQIQMNESTDRIRANGRRKKS